MRETRPSSSPLRARAPGLLPLFFSAGALALALQIVLLRELMVALQGDEASIGLGLGAWLAGIASGAAVARRLSRERPARLAAVGFGLLAISGSVGLVVARLGRLALPAPPGEVLALGPSLALAAAVLAAPGFLVGLVFTSLAAAAARGGYARGEGTARLYVLEAAGSLAAGVGVTFVAVPLLPPLHAIALASAACVLGAIPAARRGSIPGRAAFPLLALALLLLGLPPLSSAIEDATERLRFRSLVPGVPLLACEDTPYQHVAIGGDEVRHLYSGGQYAGSFPDPAQAELDAHLLACLAPSPARVLAVGRLALGGLRFVLRHPVERVDLVEIDRRAFDLVRSFLAPVDRDALADPRVHVVHDDPRRLLARGVERYGLIVVDEPDPVTLLLARLSTVEFYRLAASRLAPDGVFVTRLDTAPNVLTGETAALGGSIFGALRAAFPVVRATPGPDGLLVAGFRPDVATLDPAVLAARLRERRIVSSVLVPEMLPQILPPERVSAQEAALRQAAASIPPSRDARPVSFLHALALRQRIAGSALAPFFARLARGGGWIPALVAAAASLVAVGLTLRRKRRGGPARALAALHLAVVTGGCGMTWSLVILFAFQTRVGVLYGQLGWLTALFMLGLAAGGLAASRAASADAGESDRWLVGVSALALGFATLAGPVLGAAGAVPEGMRWIAAPALGALLLLSGLTTGMVFPVAVGVLMASGATAGDAGGRIEAADHAGAAAAALSVSVILVPAAGLLGTCSLLAALQAIAAAGVLAAATSRPSPPGRERHG